MYSFGGLTVQIPVVV